MACGTDGVSGVYYRGPSSESRYRLGVLINSR